MRPDTLSQRLNSSPPELTGNEIWSRGGIVSSSHGIFLLLVLSLGSITRLPRGYNRTKGTFACVTLFSQADVKVFGTDGPLRRPCLGGCESPAELPSSSRGHSFDLEGNTKPHLLRWISATMSAVVFLHVTTSQQEKPVFVKG